MALRQLAAAVKTLDGDGRFEFDHLTALLDTIVSMHWDLTNSLHDGADLPKSLTDHLQILDSELQATILTMKLLIREKEPPR